MIFIKKIQSENNENEYFLVTCCEDSDAEIEIALVSMTNFKCYRGLLDDEYVKRRSTKMRMPYKTYLTETRSALTQINPDCLEFVYNVTELDNNDVKFEWKKHVREEELKIVLGSVNLASSVTADLVILLFSKLSTELQRLYQKTEHHSKEQVRLETERQDLLNMVKETNEWKNKLEAEMYAKFIVILNSKKEKIKKLTNEMEHRTGSNEKKGTANTEEKLAVCSKSKEERNSNNNSLDIFSDEELNIASTSRIGRYVRSDQQLTKKIKLNEVGNENEGEPLTTDKMKKTPDAYSHTILLLNPNSDDLFDEL